MGSVIPGRGGDIRFTLDLARDEEWVGRELNLQVLRPGPSVPVVADVVAFRGRRPGRAPGPGPEGHACNDLGIAYTSP